jgi:GH15 family glucan-1,4-alpha-glucosidase
VIATVEAIDRELRVNGFVFRYDSERAESVDGLPPGEGVFLPCSFWLIDCLAMLGRDAEARRLFDHLLSLRNDLGLLSEEYDPRRERLIGNYPQAFSHVGLINTAQNLSRRLAGPAELRSREAGLVETGAIPRCARPGRRTS